MKKYGLYHRNNLLLVFLFSTEVESCFLDLGQEKYLPLPLKHLIHNKDAFKLEQSDHYMQLSEEGYLIVQQWLEDREIPLNRDGISTVKTSENLTALMLKYNACSLTDNYWVRDLNDNITWNQVKYFESDKIETYRVISNNKARYYAGVNSTLGGQLEKFWYKSIECNKTAVKLCKRVSKLDAILVIREIWATKIYEALGFSAVHYDLVYNSDHEIVGCKCKAFTSEDLELITAADLLTEYNLLSSDETYANIIQCACNYGANKKEVEMYLSVQATVDYLITNRDRHLGNIGFLRDAKSLKIVKPAPVFDSGSSRYYENEKPEGVQVTTVNGCYKTELECLQHRPIQDCLSLEKIPTDMSWFMDLPSNISRYRKEQIVSMFNAKLQFLKNGVLGATVNPMKLDF